MKKLVLFLSVAILATNLFTACGPSKEDIEKDKQRAIDSVRAIEENNRLNAENDAREEERQRIEEKQRKREEAETARNNNPANFISFKTSNQNRGAFMKDRLIVSVTNNDNSRRISNVRFRVIAYSKTDMELGSHQEVILDFIAAGQTYDRMIDYDKFHSEAKKFGIKFLSAEFAD